MDCHQKNAHSYSKLNDDDLLKIHKHKALHVLIIYLGSLPF